MTNNPPHQQRPMKNVCLSMHPDMIEQADTAAGVLQATRSEIVRRALDEYLTKHKFRKPPQVKSWRTHANTSEENPVRA